MAPGGGICKDVIESRLAFADYDMATSSSDLRGSPLRKAATGLGGNLGATSTNNVHELLECPVCLNLMYPPIYQVGSHYMPKIKNQKVLENAFSLRFYTCFIVKLVGTVT